MLDEFEERLVDLVADLLAPADEIDRVIRPGQAAAEQMLVTACVDAFKVVPGIRDDERRVLGSKGDYRLRTTLTLGGTVSLEIRQSSTNDTSRSRLVRALDRVLVVLQSAPVRDGRAFARAGEDQGFELSAFRIVSVDGSEDRLSHVHCRFEFAGDFWPVEPAVEGARIEEIPTRLALLPLGMPEGLRARPATDLDIPVRLDLRTFGGARPRLAARLSGASPVGSLIGDTDELPAGDVGYTPSADGDVHLLYRPPAALAGTAIARIELRLAHASHGSVQLGQLEVEVTGT